MIQPNPNPPAHHNAPAGTSDVSARRIAKATPSLRTRVLNCIRSHGERGATDREIQAELDLSPDTQRPRRNELVKTGSVIDSGKRRKTPSGRPAAVWIAVEHAHGREGSGTGVNS